MDIIHMEFDIGELALDRTWDTVDIIPTGGGEYHGIGLV